ncbi:type IV secretory system conjugative DNA transfer family protein [Orbus wheelerorum]|uniref:type IV secretory system conjugative DNA transfer family protein n=1 Tax=Orbus wheelerorum TaxID=3074111 RepID=UPI00370DCFED
MTFFQNKTPREKVQITVSVILITICTYLLSNLLIVGWFIPENSLVGISKLAYSTRFICMNFNLKITSSALFSAYFYIGLISLSVSLVIILIIASIMYLLHKKRKEGNNLHGQAKWSSAKEIENQKLMSKEGILVGLYNGKLLYFGGQEFVSLGAPTRSGKGTGIVIPNLMTFTNSLVVLDIKKECFDYTSKYRKEILGQNVFLFNPFNYETHCYNPLLYLNFKSPKIEMDIQGIANSLYPLNGGNNDFFTNEGKSIFIAIVYLYGMFYHNLRLAKSYTLTTIAGALNGVDIINENEQEEKIPLELAVEIAYSFNWLPDTIYNLFTSFFAQKEAGNQFAGVKTSFETALKPFNNRVIENATRHNDFDFRDLRRNKITIYLVINPEDLSSARPILNLFFSQLLFENIKQGLPDQNSELKHNVLLLMDEFTSVGFMEQYQLSVSYMAGYNLRSLIIYQNETQLRESKPLGYGNNGASTLLENHTCNIVYRPKNPKSAEEISKRIGNITTKQHNRSISNKDILNINVSRSENITARALILPQEIMDLADDEEIVLCNKVKIKCKKANYFSIPELVAKFKAVSPSLYSIKGNPSKFDYDKAVQNGELSIKLPKAIIKNNNPDNLF